MNLAALDEIENEMRAVGLWDSRPGTLEHWLQHTYLPEVRAAEQIPAPANVYDRAHDEWVKWGPEDDGPKKLLVLLRRLDRVLEFHPKVLRFGFYSTSESAEIPGGFRCEWGRALGTRFSSTEACRIAWQLEMEHEKRERMLEMVLEWSILQLANDSVFARGTHRSILPGGWTKMAFAESWGWNQPGRWVKGRYRTTVSYWGETIAEDEFTIE